MTAEQLSEWIERSNDINFRLLQTQARSSLGLVPFIGAGVSRAYGFKDWKSILRAAAPPYAIGAVDAALSANDYEGAAEHLLEKLGADGFQSMVTALSGDQQLAGFDVLTGPATLLPLIAEGLVVTTNFDGVLERVFDEAGASFESVISGPRPDLTIVALQENRHALIKLHGDWRDRVGRTFAKSDYDANYGTAQPGKKRELLDGLERLLFSSRSMLFLGASLNADRTVEMLKEVHNAYAGIRHFAILSAPSEDNLETREAQLRDCGVLPLWYQVDHDGDHNRQVDKLLREIIERMSVRNVELPKPAAAGATTAPTSAAVKPVPFTQPQRTSVAENLDVHFERLVGDIERGAVTFFLGSAIHTPTRLMANEFYKRLAILFDCTALDTDNFAVAQFIADRHGRDTLDAQICRFFEQTDLMPRVTHEVFANWNLYNAKRGKPLPYPTVITTNYDDILEQTLSASNVPYHLFSYQATGAHKGLFYHRTPGGELRVIERPKNVTALEEPGFIVVKLNGGMDFRNQIPTTFVTTRLDYWDLAARIPQVLPAIVRKQLSSSRLLFLGHGLAAQDVEALVRYTHLGRPEAKSWAVTLKSDHHAYWLQCGVEILQYDVNEYVGELGARLLG
ncbi:SIR2 family protein [Paraburkholderia sp. ZP32-5]|uniref:SIR2 family protein n=1 Tax=Paraburkholderia sp. ZP32-5 TaxID=2883245 RepID=UPI001F26D263|nr:SIR2 family protein [Paraburkholderia sp. ZP32-5]